MEDTRRKGRPAMSAYYDHQLTTDHGGSPPSYHLYWKCAHTDWCLWVAVLLMLPAMIVIWRSESWFGGLADNARNQHKPFPVHFR